MNAAHNLRKIRELKGVKQRTLAKELKMTQSNYSKLERKDRFTFEQLKEAAKALEIDPMDILKFDEKLVFNIQEQKGSNSGGLVINNFSEKIIDLYEARIKSLEDENKLLRSLLGEKNGVAV